MGEEKQRAETDDSENAVSCPFCASTDINYDEQCGDWKCAKCGRIFASPTDTDKTQNQIAAPWEIGKNSGTSETHPPKSLPRESPRPVTEVDKKLLLPFMLDMLIRWAIKLALILGSIFSLVIGVHGLHVYFNAVNGSLPEGRQATDLFLVLDVPSQLDGIVEWCTTKGLSSWTIPASIVGAAVLLLILQTYVRVNKVH
jgi:ribosomal protein L37AE/L43A